MSLTAIAALDREPTPEEAEELASGLVADVLQKNSRLSWFTSTELPPIESTGLLLHDYDQLSAHCRDAGEGGVFLVVTLDR